MRRTMLHRVHRTSRYGIYFSPRPQTGLYELGSQWLGRDATSGEELDPALSNGLRSEEWRRATESPRRYGFHATLKPPFRLAEGTAYLDLLAAAYAFAERHPSFETPGLKVGRLGRFLALTLTEPSADLCMLADECVTEFDRFRALPTEQEMAVRLHDSLTEREREHVHRWGYPYVFDTWKFHMSLTGPLSPDILPTIESALTKRFAPVCGRSILVDSICIFHQPSPGNAFQLVEQIDLRAR